MPRKINWTPDLVRKFWSGVAQTRLSELSFSRHNSEYLIELIRKYLVPHGRHLDFGAGEGDLIKALLKHGYTTAAYEPVDARARLIPEQVVNHPKFLGTIHPSSLERFDVVLMVEVIEHVLEPELDGVLRNVRSFLSDGGILIVSTPNSEDLELASAYCPQCDTLFHRWQHVRSFTPDSLPALLKEYGFECLFLHQVDFSWNRFPIEELKRLKGIKGPLSRRQRLKLFFFHQVPANSGNMYIGNQDHLLYIGKKV